MARSFGDYLNLFSLSVDVISDERFERAAQLIDKYCRETLDIESTVLYEATKIDDQDGLRQYPLDSYRSDDSFRVKDSQNVYNSQVSLSFDSQQPLWVVSVDGKALLEDAVEFADKWSNTTTLPKYRKMEGIKAGRLRTKTSICVPVLDGYRKMGVLNFSSSEHIDITETAKEELLKIAGAIGMLMRLKDVNESQRQSTDNALYELQRILASPQPRLTKPRVFLASSHKAEADVINVILEVLRSSNYSDQLELVYWKDMNEPGNINVQLLKEIGRCRYAICYFSQRSVTGEFVDNANVLFEAGMFHGRVDEISLVPGSWIPIREAASPDAPFDFAQERILAPDRDEGGALNTELFAESFRGRLDAMLALPSN